MRSIRSRRYKKKWNKILLSIAILGLVLAVAIGITLQEQRKDVNLAEALTVSQHSEASGQEIDATEAELGAISVSESTPSSLLETPVSTEMPTSIETFAFSQEPLPLCDDPVIKARWTSTDITKYSKKDVKLLPILDYAKDSTDKVAITIDDCFQLENVREILDLADKYGAKLTFFPIGYQIKKQPDLWQEILDRGHELENHSYHHVNISNLSDEKLYRTIAMVEHAMNEALGVNYKMKYFRPRGGAGRKDPRLSKVLRDLGYQAVASWGLSGSQDVNKLLRKCSGGHVILFHTTDKDLGKLRKVIPALKKKGLKMVTLNELYGKPDNLITPLPLMETATQQILRQVG